MPRLYVPDPELLRQAPECGALALLDFGLGLADSALRLEHPIAGFEHTSTRPAPTQTGLLAELLVARCLELRHLIAHYNAALDDALGLDDGFNADLWAARGIAAEHIAGNEHPPTRARSMLRAIYGWFGGEWVRRC